MEFNLHFPTPEQVIASFEGESTEPLPFTSPLTEKDKKDLAWYIEAYSASYATEVDDSRAREIAEKLDGWGEALFENAINSHRDAYQLYLDFRRERVEGRIITVSSVYPEILSLPWELLREARGTYLFNERPRITIRRNLSGRRGGRRVMPVQSKSGLHLLFAVSRPTDAPFLDPRSEPMAVLQALAAKGIDNVRVEFLRPATLRNLTERLEDESLPTVDILHFDGHGVFDAEGTLAESGDKVALPAMGEGFKQGVGDGRNMGYLAFEKAEDSSTSLVSAELLGEMLFRQEVSLVVLSACQSAMLGEEEEEEAEGEVTEETSPNPKSKIQNPKSEDLNSVAAKLTQAGIPHVIAMQYSININTTRELFSKFYEQLGQGKRLGESLETARRHLFRRAEEEHILRDWFVPCLYQASNDTSLLSPHTPLTPRTPPPLSGNLPPLKEVGFVGRSRELWDIECWFVQGTRRITISGFGGQGKTELACEAGRWLQQTKMFGQVGFVSYAAFQGIDAVGFAAATLGNAFNQSFLNAQAVSEYLATTNSPTPQTPRPPLIILDNLETIPAQPLKELLDVAKAWSEIGETRVLLTTRTPDFRHPDYRIEGSLRHRALKLEGLRLPDALECVEQRFRLPPQSPYPLPQRGELARLCLLLKCHPLSLEALAVNLKAMPSSQLGGRLQILVRETPDNPLLASLNLSLERLSPQARDLIPRLGVFQGGAFEDDLLAIAGLGDIAQQLADYPPIEFADAATWQALRQSLETAALIQPESIPGVGVAFLKFHPTLAPAMYEKLLQSKVKSQGEDTTISPTPPTLPLLQTLQERHRQRYYQLSRYLYNEDTPNPFFARAIASRELPNLLHAVKGALEARATYAVDFVDKVNRFLNIFGLPKDREYLSQEAAKLAGEAGTDTWYLARSTLGEQLFDASRYAEAEAIFREVLAALGESASYNRCYTLQMLGRCLGRQGQAQQAADCYQQGIAVAQQLEATAGVKRQVSATQAELGGVLTDLGQYQEAREAYQASLAMMEETGDERSAAVVKGQLGRLSLVQGNLAEAEASYQEALQAFRQLGEPATEALSLHQLGRVYEEAQQWQPAEAYYRQAAQLQESQGNLQGAATIWNQIALVNMSAGSPDLAAQWYRKAIAVFKDAGYTLGVSLGLNNLADLLQGDSNRLPEAKQLAEEALAIKQTLDPAAAQIWTTYLILAEIAEKQGDSSTARDYRRQSRQAKWAYAGTQYELQRFAPLLEMVVGVSQSQLPIEQVEADFAQLEAAGWGKLVAALRRFLAGERDEDSLCEGLDLEDSMVVMALLNGSLGVGG